MVEVPRKNTVRSIDACFEKLFPPKPLLIDHRGLVLERSFESLWGLRKLSDSVPIRKEIRNVILKLRASAPFAQDELYSCTDCRLMQASREGVLHYCCTVQSLLDVDDHDSLLNTSCFQPRRNAVYVQCATHSRCYSAKGVMTCLRLRRAG